MPLLSPSTAVRPSMTAHYAEDKPVTKPDADNSGTITQEEAQRQTTLLDMLSRFIVSLFR